MQRGPEALIPLRLVALFGSYSPAAIVMGLTSDERTIRTRAFTVHVEHCCLSIFLFDLGSN